MSADLYPRPSREEIAAKYIDTLGERAAAVAQGVADDDLSDVVTRREPEPQESPDPLACFSVHLSARMRALGWDQTRLQERAGISPHAAAKAINGNGCDLAVAGKIAAVVGGHLAAMIGPYICATCAGEPPQGFGCLECGTETRAAS